MNIVPEDLKTRLEALNTSRSFIVRAPAGSGKTELLLMRYFKLILKCVNPYKIYITTFSIKATKEIRERLVFVLNNVNGVCKRPIEELAYKVKQKMNMCGWKEEDLNILTIDSLAYKHLANHLKTRTISNNQDFIYKLIAESVFIFSNSSPILKKHLFALGNLYRYRYNKIIASFVNFMQNRHDWFALLENKNTNLIDGYESFVVCLLTCLYKHFKDNTELCLNKKPLLPLFSNLSYYKEWIKYLFTKEGYLRASKAHICDSPPDNYIIILIACAPEDSRLIYDASIFSSVIYIIKFLNKQLNLYMKKNSKLDFPALYLEHNLIENNIEHLLIDEFQDISINQYKFIVAICNSMNPNNGHTLFFVGDPMQSIYKFRQSDISIFLNLTRSKLALFTLEYLSLSSNFRSSNTLVYYFNKIFQAILPYENNLMNSQPAFQNSIPVQINKYDIFNANNIFNIKAYKNMQAQYLDVAAHIKDFLIQEPDKTIALLVRTRASVKGLLEILEEKQIAYNNYLENAYDQVSVKILCIFWYLIYDNNSVYYWSLLLNLEVFDLAKEDVISVVGNSCILLQLKHHLIFKPYIAIIENVKLTCANKIQSLWLIINRYKKYDEKCLNIFLGQIQELAKIPHDLDASYADLIESLQNISFFKQVESNISIITIHQSKGLEFDFVIILQSQKSTKSNNEANIVYNTFHFHDLALIVLYGLKDTPLGNMIQTLQKEKYREEIKRLLYVAITRARHRILITYVMSKTYDKRSFMYLLNQVSLTKP